MITLETFSAVLHWQEETYKRVKRLRPKIKKVEFLYDLTRFLDLNWRRVWHATLDCNSPEYHKYYAADYNADRYPKPVRAIEHQLEVIAQKYNMHYYSSDGGLSNRLRPDEVSQDDVGGMIYLPHFDDEE